MVEQHSILIVDDEPLGRETLRALLHGKGHRLIFAGSGQEALELAETWKPDLILLDVMMPGMDGFEVCRRIRQTPSLAEVPIVMITALGDRASRIKGLNVGADDFITKPFDRTELRARIRTILRLNRYRRLLAVRSRFEWVVENAESGYLMLDKEGIILYANEQARRYIVGSPAIPLVGKPLFQLVRDNYRCEPLMGWDECFLLPTMKRAGSPHYLVRAATSYAPEFWLQVDVAMMEDVGDETILVRLRDITETIRLRKEVWRFDALVRHKLRSPLGILVGSLELFRRDGEMLSREDMEMLIEMVYSGARRLRDAIESIFVFEEAPQMGLMATTHFKLDELPALLTHVSEALSIAQPDLKLPPQEQVEAVPPLALSPEAMELIFWELLENAKKFHPQHEPTVSIEVEIVGTEGVRFKVMDDGISLAPDQLRRIWLPYYQAERYFTGQVPGMGLGLPTIASLLWGLGGKIDAYNRLPGPGLVVDFTVPFYESGAGEQERPGEEGGEAFSATPFRR